MALVCVRASFGLSRNFVDVNRVKIVLLLC